MNKKELIKELTKRYQDELEKPSKGGYYGETKEVNKSKLKRLRLLLIEVMRELEEDLK